MPWYSDVSQVGDYGDGPWAYWSWTANSGGTYTLEYRVANALDSGLASYAVFDAAIFIKNAGFETGDFSYWTPYVPVGGSATVVTSHYGDRGLHYPPVIGDHFALLKTDGPGSYTTLSQTFAIAAGQTIDGWAALDSRDYVPYNDNAMVRILDGSGNQVAMPWYSDVSQVGDYGDGPWTYWSWTAGSGGTYTLEYRIANAVDSGLASYAVFDGDQFVQNQPPVADAGGPYVASEGNIVTFDASGSSDPDGDSLEYRWDFDSNGVWDTAGSTDPTAQMFYADDYIGMVTVEISDGEETDTDTASIAVNNVVPAVDAGSDQMVDEGSTVPVAATFTDPGADTHTAKIHWGDGSPEEVATITGNTVSGSHVYADNGVYGVKITVTDDDNGENYDFLQVTVNNVAPTANANGPYQSSEGTPIGFTGSATDPGADSLEYRWFIDGSWTAWSANPSASYTYDDDYSGSVTLEVRDDDGDVGSASADVSVNNVAPATDAGADQVVDEGDIVYFSGSYSDPGADSHTVAWSIEGVIIEGTLMPTNVYDDDGVYNVYFNVVDDDGGYGNDDLTVTVLNVAPTAYAGGPYSGDEGSSIAFIGSASDPGADTHEYRWNIDGSWTAWSTDPSASHTWDDDYSGSVTLEVRDDDGGVGSSTTEVDVYNVAPTVDAGTDQTVYSGSAVGASASYSDPGADTHTAVIAWGDGEVDSLDPTTSPVTGSYTYYPIGTYTVTVTVTDDDGGVGYDTFDVTVECLPVAIDIKPGSDPNSLNREKKNGRTPVAIINDGTIDPADVDPETVVFAGASPVHWALEDVDGDGDTDMIFHFLTQETDITLDSVSATLEADLYDGTQITGEDSVRIVPPDNPGGSNEGNAANDQGNNGKKDKGK